MIDQIASLKRNVLGAPFDTCFEALKKGSASSLSPIEIPFRPTEKIYVQPKDDRIVVVFSVCFEDKTDQAIARVFLQVHWRLHKIDKDRSLPNRDVA